VQLAASQEISVATLRRAATARAIARTLAYKPQVLLFDEPFGALDAQTRVHLRREIRALLRQVRVPSVFITHDQEEALELGDRIAVLNEGHLEQIGTPDEVYNHPETEYVATFLGAANLLLGVATQGTVEIGTAKLPAEKETKRFREGQSVKLVFRPEDVCISKDANLPKVVAADKWRDRGSKFCGRLSTSDHSS
jgi:sulfate transport system ATP-binding protein